MRATCRMTGVAKGTVLKLLVDLGVACERYQDETLRGLKLKKRPGLTLHVQHASGKAKFWLEPDVELGAEYGLGGRRVNSARKIIEEHRDEIRAAWERHFGG